MMVVNIGRGSVVVNNPTQAVIDSLRRFRRADDGSGEYEELYAIGGHDGALFTMPGFAKRISDIGGIVRDRRAPMPDPDIAAALNGLPDVLSGCVSSALSANGGVVSVPDVIDGAEFAAALLRAYPRDGLMLRTTPLSVVAAKDARAMAKRLKELLPEREIGVSSKRACADSDDIIVVSYGDLEDVPPHFIGILIGCDLSDVDVFKWTTPISSIRNSARWGIYSTPEGGSQIDMATEGLFGPVVSSLTHSDAVQAGAAAPVTVCWLPAPHPMAYMGSAPQSALEKIAMYDNAQFMHMCSRIMDVAGEGPGCLLVTDNMHMLKRAALCSKGVVEIHKKIAMNVRKAMLADIAAGSVRRAVVAYDCMESGMGVVISAMCGNSVAIPWRVSAGNDRTFMVDFSHDWDLHNGRPGRLKLNDENRKRRYGALGFSQMSLSCIDELPFMGANNPTKGG